MDLCVNQGTVLRLIMKSAETSPDSFQERNYIIHTFSPDFLVGAATAAHQVEGNNRNSDFWAQEQMTFTAYAEPSLDAVDHFHRYEEDIQLMAATGLNAYHFFILTIAFLNSL